MTISVLTSAGTSATSTSPLIILPNSIQAGSTAYITLVTAGGALPTLTGFTGWTVVSAPGGHTTGGDAWLLSKSVGIADSGTTANGTISASQKWNIGCAVLNASQDASPVLSQTTSLTASPSVPAITPVANDCMDLLIGVVIDGSGAGAVSVTPPTGFTEDLDSSSSTGTGGDASVFVSHKQLVGQAGVAQGSTTIGASPTSRAYVWRVTLASVNTAPTAAVTVTDLNDRTITYNTTGSAGTGGATIASYDLDWGDSTAHGSSASGTHAYTANGNYTVTLTVTDSNGLTDTATFNVQVASGLGEASAGIVALASGWTATPSSGSTMQEIMNDADGGSFLQSPNNPSSSEQPIRMQKLAYSSGQDVSFAITLDRISGTSGNVDVSLREGATTRATVSGLTPTVGTVGTDVVAVVSGTFPAANLAAVTDWGNVSLVPSVTAS